MVCMYKYFFFFVKDSSKFVMYNFMFRKMAWFEKVLLVSEVTLVMIFSFHGKGFIILYSNSLPMSSFSYSKYTYIWLQILLE